MAIACLRSICSALASDERAIDYSVEVWEALLADFCAELVQESAVFVGNSIGALLSLMILANHPDLARGGILLNKAAGLNHHPDELTLPLRVVMGTFLILPTDESGGFLMYSTKGLSSPDIKLSAAQVHLKLSL